MSTSYFKGEPKLSLTTADVTRATGIEIRPGMTIEHRYGNGHFEVRVLDGMFDDDGQVLADWTTVEP